MPSPVTTLPRMTPLPTIDLPTFEALARLPGVTLIDFTAKWCGPCKVLAPVLAALATEYDGRARMAAIDVNDEPGLAAGNGRQRGAGARGAVWRALDADGRRAARRSRGRPDRRQPAARVRRGRARSCARRRRRDRESVIGYRRG